LVISSEDVGLASPAVVLRIKALYDMYCRNKKSRESRLHFTHAILILVRAPKSRIVDHATIVFFEGVRKKREIPEFALDVHTPRGKIMGRNYEDFFAEGATLVNAADLEDTYRERARRIRCGK
jgi:replication-associated recombination protein RarA